MSRRWMLPCYRPRASPTTSWPWGTPVMAPGLLGIVPWYYEKYMGTKGRFWRLSFEIDTVPINLDFIFSGVRPSNFAHEWRHQAFDPWAHLFPWKGSTQPDMVVQHNRNKHATNMATNGENNHENGQTHQLQWGLKHVKKWPRVFDPREWRECGWWVLQVRYEPTDI